MSMTKHGVRNLNGIRSSKPNPRVVRKADILPLMLDCNHAWSLWEGQSGGDGMTNDYVRHCMDCGATEDRYE